MNWQPIETAPKDGRPVWARGYDYGDKSQGEHRRWAWWNGRYWQDASDDSILTHLTEWMENP